MKYAFARAVAHVNRALGITFIIGSAVLAVVVFFIPPGDVAGRSVPLLREPILRVALSAAIFIVGGAIGAGLVACGDLVLAFLDIETRVRRIDRRLREWEVSQERR